GTYTWKNESVEVAEEALFFDVVGINIDMKIGYDSRMEMIDLLHYIQYSGLLENALEDSYTIRMSIFSERKPGMNEVEAHQSSRISTEKIGAMDFSDKDMMLVELSRYGNFEGVNPS